MIRMRTLVALFLVYLMSPGVNEVAENLIHFAATGHSAHALDDADHDFGDDEHGCSGPFHLCACHTSTLFHAQAIRADLTPTLALERDESWRTDTDPGDGYGLGIFRPPIV